MRLPRGESLDALSRETRVLAGNLSFWRERLLAAGQAGLKRCSVDRKVITLEQELKRNHYLSIDISSRKVIGWEIHDHADITTP